MEPVPTEAAAGQGVSRWGEPGGYERRSVEVELPRPGEPLPLRVSWPVGAPRPAPLVVWSHGLGASRDAYRPLVEHWVRHGYVVVQPSHRDSRQRADEGEREPLRVVMERPADISTILDRLDEVLALAGAPPAVVDRERVGVGGHSFGAQTTLVVGGLELVHPRTGERWTDPDPRADALLAVSPQGTGRGLEPDSFRLVKGPVLVVTGSEDASPLTGQGPEWRLEAWENLLPAPRRHLLYIEGADHSFGGVGRPVVAEGLPDPARWLLEASTAFWAATLLDDEAAAAFLEGDALSRRTEGAARTETKPPE